MDFEMKFGKDLVLDARLDMSVAKQIEVKGTHLLHELGYGTHQPVIINQCVSMLKNVGMMQIFLVEMLKPLHDMPTPKKVKGQPDKGVLDEAWNHRVNELYESYTKEVGDHDHLAEFILDKFNEWNSPRWFKNEKARMEADKRAVIEAELRPKIEAEMREKIMAEVGPVAENETGDPETHTAPNE